VSRSILLLLVLIPQAAAREPIRLANNPALTPDGKMLAFDHLGDIWTVPSTGGVARPLTHNTSKDLSPKFSPDGKEIAFISDREGSAQVYLMPAEGGTPRQITFHTSGYMLHEWAPDGNHVLVSVMRDHGWSRRQPERFYLVNVRERKGEQLLFDDYGTNGSFSPDGSKILFNREGPTDWWRKGYTGSQASQVWTYDLKSKRFEPILLEEIDHRWPLWQADGKGIFFCTNRKNGHVLEQMSLEPRPISSRPERKPINARTIAAFPDDSIVYPCISRDGATIVFRHLFDFYRMESGQKEPAKIAIFRDDDRPVERLERRSLDRASAVSFTNDGLEIAFIAGGDLWVMDTEFREPKRVTNSATEERSPHFTPDGQAIYFIGDTNGKTDIWKATRSDPKKGWWLNSTFKLEPVTTDGDAKSNLSFSPDGSRMAYGRGRGDLWVANVDGSKLARVLESWNQSAYDWSPDGQWLVYAVYDNDSNRDVWIKKIGGMQPAYNISRHPYNEGDPVWSPDGRVIAFTAAREVKENTDIHFVYLRAEDDEKDSRDRNFEKAIEKIQKGRTPPMIRKPSDEAPELAPEPKVKNDKKIVAPVKKTPPETIIDFEGLHERIRRASIPNTNESNLFWSPDSMKLAFTASVDGQPGTYTIELPDNLKPTQLSSQTGTYARWLKNGSIVWLSGGVPASISGSSTAPTPSPLVRPPTITGTRTTGAPAGGYRFTAYQEVDVAKKHQAVFDQCWSIMRDHWYDEKLGNRDWNAVRDKFLPIAETADQETLQTVVWLMLGELNGSHLGFFAGSTTLPTRRPGLPPEEPASGEHKWTAMTAHLGVRFDETHNGPGLKIRDVLPEGPADQKKSRLLPGEIILKIDETAVDPSMDLTTVLNGVPSRDVSLHVKDAAGKERDVVIRPINFTMARQLVYKHWLRENRKSVEKLSNGTLGYLHIRAMDMSSFREFEEELYNAGSGKQGLVIDVRENGGGSTTDHLLTALTQPRHAIAVPRGSSMQGYPQDRTVYATWNKPIIVLCNQNSFSNAEIFSHAIKTLKRGHLVGVPTAGGVISTGGVAIMDVGFMRLPTRGWYLLDTGEDMELNGAVPHHVLWPQPGDTPKGKDDQIAKAVEVLLKDVKEAANQPQPKLKKATER